jgi:uncharacterized RDD family membrane protein YckC
MQQPEWYAPPGGHPGHPDPQNQQGMSEAMLEPGGFGIRAAAQVIDIVATMLVAVVAGAAGGVFIAILATLGIASAGWEQRIGKSDALTVLIGIIASLAYHTFAEALGGATVGKAICGLRVLGERREPCSFGKALGRNLAYYIDAMFFGLVGWTSMSQSPFMQRYGDKWAGTIVIRTRSAHGMTMRSPVVGILVGFVAYGLLEFAAVIIKGL